MEEVLSAAHSRVYLNRAGLYSGKLFIEQARIDDLIRLTAADGLVRMDIAEGSIQQLETIEVISQGEGLTSIKGNPHAAGIWYDGSIYPARTAARTTGDGTKSSG